MSTPELAPLRKVVGALQRAGVTCALGGSGLVVALGLDHHARDWDVTTDAPLEQVLAALDSFPARREGPQGIHADHKLILEDGRIEVIVGFAIRSGEAVVHLPTRVTREFEGIPIGSPVVWAVAYTLLGRAAKATLLFDWLDRNGADRESLNRLREEPLPPELERRLLALTKGRPSG